MGDQQTRKDGGAQSENHDEPVIVLFQVEQGEQQTEPASGGGRTILDGDEESVQGCQSQAGAKAFEHDVGGVAAVRRAGEDEEQGGQASDIAPARRRPPGRQEGEQGCRRPTRQAGQHRKTIIEAPQQQRQRRQDAVQGAPDAGPVQLLEKLQPVPVTNFLGQGQRQEVVGVAVVRTIHPEQPIATQKAHVQQRRGRRDHEQHDAEHDAIPARSVDLRY